MKKYMGAFSCNGASDIRVFADTKEEAGKIALEHFISRVREELKVYEMKAKTERCDICQYTYIPSEIVDTISEQLCVYCHKDKYGYEALRPEDIPFYFICTPCSLTHYTVAGKLELNRVIG